MKPFTRKLEILEHVFESCSLGEFLPSLLFKFIWRLHSLWSYMCCKYSEHSFDILKCGISNINFRFQFKYLLLNTRHTCLPLWNHLIFLLSIVLFLIIFILPVIDPKLADFYHTPAPMTVAVRPTTTPIYCLAIEFPILSTKSKYFLN